MAHSPQNQRKMNKETKVVSTAETKYRIIGLSYTKPRAYGLTSGETVFSRYMVSVTAGMPDETQMRVDRIEYDDSLKAFKVFYVRGVAKDAKDRMRVIPINAETEVYYEAI